MPSPYDYSLNLPDPTQVFMQSFQLGQQLKKQAQAQKLQERRAETYSKLGPNATYDDYMAAIKALPEDTSELLATMKAMGTAKQTAMFDAGGKAWALLQPGADGNIDPAQALSRLEEYAAAFENSGDAETARQLRDAAKAVEINPAHGRTVLGTMLAMADAEKFKTISEIGVNKYEKDIADLTAVFGADTARRMVAGREAAKGVVSATGPAGTQFVRAEDVFKVPAEQQPEAAASVAAGADSQEYMTADQFKSMAGALGQAGAEAMIKRNGIPVRVSTPEEARKFPSGTRIVTPDGRFGVVP